MNALNFGGKLIFNTVSGNSTLTFDAASGNAQTGGAASKILVINSGVTLNVAGSFDLVGSTSTLPARYLQIDGAGNMVFTGELRNNASGASLTAGTKGGFNKTGSGTLTLNGANTFDAGAIIAAGYVNLGSAEDSVNQTGPLGKSGLITMTGGYLQYSVNNQYDYSSRFDNANTSPQKYNVDTNTQNVTWASALTSVGGSLTKTGQGTLKVSGANTYDSGTTLNGGSLELGSATAIGSTGTISFTGGTLRFTSSNASDYSSRFSNAAAQLYNLDTNGQTVTLGTALTSVGGTLTKNGNGVLNLNGANTYTGDTTVNQGTLAATSAGVLSGGSSVVVQSGAVLDLNTTDQSIKGLAGSGSVSLGTANLTISDGDSRTFSGDIIGGGNVIKSGSGTQVFSSSLSYAGTTSVNNGTLRVNGTLASSAVSVAGSAVLTGKGTISGPVTIAASGIITAGDTTLADASRGSLTLSSSLTFAGSAAINLANINLGNSSSILTVGAISTNATNGLISINAINNSELLSNSSFVLLKYTSLDNINAFTVGTIGGTNSRQAVKIENDSANNQIVLTTAGDTLKWTGNGSLLPLWTTVVDNQNNQNWKLSIAGTAVDYLTGDTLRFDDSTTNFVVTLGENVSPGTLTFDNSTNYTVKSADGSTFTISGSKGLIKTGTGRVDLNTPISITGGITVNNGTLALNGSGNSFTGNVSLNGAAILELGAVGATGTTNSLTFGAGATGKLSLNGNNATLTGLSNNAGNVGTPIIENGSSSTNATLTLNIASGTNTFDGLIKNGGTPTLSLTKTGSGTLVLTNDNTFTGQTTVTAGTLQLGLSNGSSTGSIAGNIAVGASGTLNLNRTGKFSTLGILSGSGTLNLNYGQLELLGSNTFTGTAAISSGATLTIGTNASFSTSATIANAGTLEYSKSGPYNIGAMSGNGNLTILTGTASQIGNNSLKGTLTIATDAIYQLTTTGLFTSITSIIDNGTLTIGDHATYTIAAPITGTGALSSNIGSGKVLYLTADNTYQGVTTVTTGTLNVGNGSSAGSLGTGAVTVASVAELILSRSGETSLSNTITGAGKLTLGTSGKVNVTADNQINITGELKFGAIAGTSTHSTLDLSNGSITVGSLRVQTDAKTGGGTNNIIIGSGKSLDVKGLVTVGVDYGSSPITSLTMSGLGTFNIGTSTSASNSNVVIGASSSGNMNYVNWDMSGLSTLNMYLGTGSLIVGADVGGITSLKTDSSTTVRLAANSTITASAISMDEANARVFNLVLGSGLTTLSVDNINVVGPTGSARCQSYIYFNNGDGTLNVRAKSTTNESRAALNIGNSTNATGSGLLGSVDLSNHSTDLLLSTVTVGKRDNLTGTSAVGYGSGKLLFGTGTFDAQILNIANKSNYGSTTAASLTSSTGQVITGSIVGMVSFGDATVRVGTVDVARHASSYNGGKVQGLLEFGGSTSSNYALTNVTIATASTTTIGAAEATGYFNISGGNAYVTTLSGASAATNTIATANVNITGGSLTMAGNITRTGGAGTSAFNLNLSGGTLDMGGFAIGTTGAGSNVNFTWTSGTLKNVSGLNGADGITVDTGNQSNPVYLGGTNSFTSKITIKDSILQLQSTTALAANSQIGFVGTLGVLKLDSGVALDVSSNLTSGNAQLDTGTNNVTFNNSVIGLTSFTKLGGGKLTLSSSSGSLAPIVTIFGGTLELGNGNNQIPSGGFLSGTNTLTLDASGGSPELIANGVKVDLNADVNILNGGAVISGSKGISSYSFNFLKGIIAQDGSTATMSATDMITGTSSYISVGSGATLTVTGSFIDGATATQITKNGTGTLEFTGTTANTYSGATTVNAGTLKIYSGALNSSSTAITVNNGANLTAVDLGANVSITVATSGKADISGTNLNVKDIVTQNSTRGEFIFSGTGGKITAKSLSGSGSITLASDSLEVDTLNGAGSIVFSGATSTIAAGSGSFSGTITGAQSFVKQGSGILAISGNNALTGIVKLNDGILSLTDLASLSAASELPGNLVFQGGKLQYTGTAPATMTRGFTVGNGGAGFISIGSGALTISGDMDFADTSASNRTLSLGGTSNIAIENIYNPNKIDGNDVKNLFTKLVKQDTNKWIVLGAGAGFFEDAQTEIDIQNGELGFGMAALGTKSTITLDGLSGATATLGWANGNTEDISGRVNLRNNSSAAFDIPSGSTVTFASALNAGVPTSASVTMSGGGTLNLNASNPFTGGFTISGGTVKAGITGAVGSGTVTVNANSTLVVNAVLANTITIKSSGTLTSDVANQVIDDTTVEQGGILVPGGDAIGTMRVNNLTLKRGSVVNWQISNAVGAVDNIYSQAGIGYDTFILNSLLLTDASLSNPIHIKVKSVSGQKATNFDKTAVQTFKFAKLTNALSKSDAANVTDLFEINATEFEFINGLQTDHLVWRMTVSADRDYLYVVAIPEPSTYGLGLGALALAAAAVRRRKQKKNSTAV
jgi:autotransporter-associated beta strand protein